MMEFALVAPILFALVFGIFDFGRAMSANVTVTNSAREGARYAATHTVNWPSGTLTAAQARFGFECPTGSPLNVADAGPTQAAWHQAQAANLDLSQLSITVYYYDYLHDPSTASGYAEKESCTSGVAHEVDNTGTPSTSYKPGSGDWVKVEVVYNYAPVTPFISSLIKTVTIDQTSIMVLE